MKINRRDELLHQIVPLFNKHGYWKIRVDDIAKELKISKKTLYVEFKNKKDIIQNVITLRVHNMEKSAKKANEKSSDAISAFLSILSEFYNNIDIDQDTLNFDILQRYYNELYDFQIHSIYNAIRKVVRQNFVRGQHEGLYKSEFNAEFIGNFWAISFLNNRIGKFEEKSPSKLKKQKQDTIRLLLNGMVTEKGKALLDEKMKDYPI